MIYHDMKSLKTLKSFESFVPSQRSALPGGKAPGSTSRAAQGMRTRTQGGAVRQILQRYHALRDTISIHYHRHVPGPS